MLGVRPGLPACYYVPASSALPVCCLQIIVALITLAKVSRPRTVCCPVATPGGVRVRRYMDPFALGTSLTAPASCAAWAMRTWHA